MPPTAEALLDTWILWLEGQPREKPVDVDRRSGRPLVGDVVAIGHDLESPSKDFVVVEVTVPVCTSQEAGEKTGRRWVVLVRPEGVEEPPSARAAAAFDMSAPLPVERFIARRIAGDVQQSIVQAVRSDGLRPTLSESTIRAEVARLVAGGA